MFTHFRCSLIIRFGGAGGILFAVGQRFYDASFIHYQRLDIQEKVEAGDGICVLEAMKMENVLPAPDDGKVVALSCQPGEKVRLDQTLAVIG